MLFKGLEEGGGGGNTLIKSRDQNAGQNHSMKIDSSYFERVEDFKYLGTTLLTYLRHGAEPLLKS